MNPDTPSSAGAADRLGPLGQSLHDAELPACVRDAGGRYVAVNGAFAELVGLEAARVVGKTDNALQPADVAHRVAELDALVLEAHGHLDANETVLARDGRRIVRACRFPVYYEGDVWGICVVMSPGDDPEAGRIAREALQVGAGQTASAAAGQASSEELLAERDRAGAADAEAHAAREALAIEREARLAAEISARTAGDELAAAKEQLGRSRAELARLDDQREEAQDRIAELNATLSANSEHAAHTESELADARRRAEEAELQLSELAGLDSAHRSLVHDLESLQSAYADLQAAGQENEAARERYSSELAEALADQQDLERALKDAIAARDDAGDSFDGLRQRFDQAENALEEERNRSEWLATELTAAQERERAAVEDSGQQAQRREQLEQALASSTAAAGELSEELERIRGEAAATAAAAGELESETRRADDAERAVEAARAHSDGLGEQLALAQAALEAADDRLAEEQQRFATTLEQTEARVAAERSRASQLESAIQSATSGNGAALAAEREARLELEREHKRLQREHESAQSANARLEVEVAAWRERTTELETAQAEINAVANDAAEVENISLRAQLAEVRSDHDADRGRIGELEQELEWARHSGSEFERALAESHAVVAAERERAEAAADEATRLREQSQSTGDHLAREIDAALARAGSAEQAADRARAAQETIEAQLRELRAEHDALRAERPDGELEARLEALGARAAAAEQERDALRSRADVAQNRIADLTAARDLALRARDEAADALTHAGAAGNAEAGVLREQLTAANATIDELRTSLAAERGARENLERKLTEAGSSPAATPQGTAQAPAPNSLSIPAPPAPGVLPSLAVAAEQARRFAQAAPATATATPTGITDAVLAELDAALARAGSPRSAGRIALEKMATATGWTGGAFWQPREDNDRVFNCTETWTAYMSRLEAWETMAWRAHLEDGLVPAAAGSANAHWASTEEALACPRSRAADWADLKTLATIPVVGDEQQVLAIIELVRRDAEEPDQELLATLTAVAGRLAARLDELRTLVRDTAPVGRV